MYRIVRKKILNPSVVMMDIEAPYVARKAQAGQFIIFRVDEFSERVPLTIADYDREKETVTIRQTEKHRCCPAKRRRVAIGGRLY